MKLYDAIVVGAGPAGASAAYELAKSGCRVLLLERAKLPRYKTCGGGIPLPFFRTLPARPQQTLETVLTQAVCIGPRHSKFVTENVAPVAGVIRERFDYEFTMAAVDEHVELIDANPVVSVEERADRVVVNAQQGTFAGRYLVGADGPTGVVKRFAGVGSRIGQAPALEVEIRREPSPEDVTRVHFTFIRDGYAWVFPKRGVHSLGLLSFNRDRHRVKQKLTEWASLCGYSLDGQHVHGHPIPIWRGKAPLATHRVLLAGDAAGTVDPLGGEGIRYGIISGRIAADFIRKALLTGDNPSLYTEALYEAIHRDFVYARKLAAVFYRFPAFSFHMWVRSPMAMDSLAKILNGDLRYRDLFQFTLRSLLLPQNYLRFLTKRPS